MTNQFLDFTVFPIIETDTLLEKAIGNNKKGLLILCLDSNLEEQHLELLPNILKAIQYDLAEDALLLKLNPNSRIRLIDLYKKNTVKDVIIFGLMPKQLGLHFQCKLYENWTHEEYRYLVAHHLVDIEADKQKKGMLWQQLQSMFLENKPSN